MASLRRKSLATCDATTRPFQWKFTSAILTLRLDADYSLSGLTIF